MTQRNLTVSYVQIQGPSNSNLVWPLFAMASEYIGAPNPASSPQLQFKSIYRLPSSRVLRLGKDDPSALDGLTMKALDQSTAQCEKPVKEKSAAAIAWVRAQPIRHDFIRLYSAVWKPYVGISRTRIFVNRLRPILRDCEKCQGSSSSKLLIGNRWSIVAVVSGAPRLKCLTSRDTSVARK